jgi:flagellar basal body-associated protein FliL
VAQATRATSRKKDLLVAASTAAILAASGAVGFVAGAPRASAGVERGTEPARGSARAPEAPEEAEHGSEAEPASAPKPSVHEKPAAAKESGHGAKAEGGGGHGSGSGAPKAPAPAETRGAMLLLDPFVMNLADPEGNRYARVRINVLFDAPEAAAEAAEGLVHVRLRDRILTALASKTAEEVTTFAGKEELRAELRGSIAQMVADKARGAEGEAGASAGVRDVLFREFLVQ